METDQRRLFERMFHPKSIAIVGISRTYSGLGGQFFLKNVQRAQFPGKIYLIHPTAREISGMKAYPSISALPEAVDLAMVCVPAQFVPRVLEECSRKGVRNIHILSSGFKELGTPEGIGLEEEVRRLFILGGGGGNSVYYADICMRMGLQVPPLTGDTRDQISGMVPSVGSFARNPVDAWKAFYDPEYLSRMLEIVFEDPALDMILLDRLIPRMTYASPEEKDTSQITIQYLRENRHRKALVVVVDGAGEDPSLAGEAAGLRQRYCRAGIPAYPSLPLAAQALARVTAYYERK